MLRGDGEVNELERLRALVYARRMMGLQVDEAVHEALDAGVPRFRLAAVLCISRSQLYRQYGCWIGDDGEGVRDVCESEEVQKLRPGNQGD